jgi:peptide/nickel transport system substrate-binding protein
LFGGKQPVAHTSINPLDWVFAADVPTYALDLEKADALLNDAGWPKKADGMRANASGEPLRFEIMTTAGNRTRELVEQVLQSQWKAAGIDIRIRNEPARVFFGETVTKRKFDSMAMFAWISSPESVPRTTLHSEEIPTEANNWSGQNYTGFKNAEMDTLLEDIELELDREKRKQLWSRLQHIYASELPALPLYFRANSYILPKWLSGITPTGHQFPSTLWVEDWTVGK